VWHHNSSYRAAKRKSVAIHASGVRFGHPVPGTSAKLADANRMMNFLLWCILLVLCWPLALAALIIYPIVWLILLPFRIIGIVFTGVFDLLWAIVTLPARILRGPHRV
jgi:hypothetical protein